jgi:tetrahydromethanopterin S-methyltransferase subunit B
MDSKKLHNTGKGLVKFAWGVEILAVLIGLLISLMVSISVYREISFSERGFEFADLSAILVAGLPFMLVAVVELCKIPLATAMMFAKHFVWRLGFLVAVLLLSIITFETMLNGFERNFSNLTLSIDEQKDKGKRINRTIENINGKKVDLLYFTRDEVDSEFEQVLAVNNDNYNRELDRQRGFITTQLSRIDTSHIAETETKINELYNRQQQVYDLWDDERNEIQLRIRGLLNNNIGNVLGDKDKLSKELDALKAEMKQAMSDATFLTRDSVERKYRGLVKAKEQRLYQVTDYSAGQQALSQQTDSEAMLQQQLAAVASKYQGRINDLEQRIERLRARMNSQIAEDQGLRKRYQTQYANFAGKVRSVRDSNNVKAEGERDDKMVELDEIMVSVKVLDDELYMLNEQLIDVHFQINRLVSRNQIYRIAAYITNNENAVDVPKSVVGLVALLWFASLSFICAVTGVFLAIAGMYLMRVYPDNDEQGADYLTQAAEQLSEQQQAQLKTELDAVATAKSTEPRQTEPA